MKGKERKGLSIKIVAALYSIIAITVLTVVIVLIGYHLFRINVTENYEKYTLTVLENAYTIASDFSFGDMIADRSMPHKYEELRERLNKIKETSDIQYLYAIYFDDIEDSGSLMYAINTKTTEELAHGGTYTYLGTACEEGSFQPETIDTLWNAVKNGQQESGILQGYSEGYGYMLNGYKVIFDSDGNAVGLLCVEIDITNIHVVLNRYVRNVIIFAALFMIVLTVFMSVRSNIHLYSR